MLRSRTIIIISIVILGQLRQSGWLLFPRNFPNNKTDLEPRYFASEKVFFLLNNMDMYTYVQSNQLYDDLFLVTATAVT